MSDHQVGPEAPPARSAAIEPELRAAKIDLRARLQALRRSLPAAQRQAESAAACRVCVDLLPGEPASYAALPDELDLAELHHQRWERGEAVLLPRVLADRAMAWHRVGSAAHLRPGFRSIAEPDPSQSPTVRLPLGAIIFIPGLAFTRDGRRLGQGGGYYDRLLAQRPDLRAIGVGFACQLLDDLPCESHDRSLRGLVIAGDIVLAPP